MVLKNQALHKETVALQQRLHAAELQVEVEKLKVQEQQDAKERLREEITTLQKEVQGLSQKNAAQHRELLQKDQDIEKERAKRQAMLQHDMSVDVSSTVRVLLVAIM